MWHSFANWLHEIWIALVFAIIFAAIADLTRIGSRIRETVREVRNKLAEASTVRLATRIRRLEQSKEQVSKLMSSDRAVYVQSLQYILCTMAFLALGCATVLGAGTINSIRRNHLDISLFIRAFWTTGIFSLFIGACVGFFGWLNLIDLDSYEKFNKLSDVLQAEIDDLSEKLAARQDSQMRQ
jgi:hypothetical protein